MTDDLLKRLRRKVQASPMQGSGSISSDGTVRVEMTDDGKRLVNPDGPEAADRIEALTVENERLQTGVRWPTCEDEAVAMFLVSERWLRDNAPHRFTARAALGDTQ